VPLTNKQISTLLILAIIVPLTGRYREDPQGRVPGSSPLQFRALGDPGARAQGLQDEGEDIGEGDKGP
jgi:hypothetical protein